MRYHKVIYHKMFHFISWFSWNTVHWFRRNGSCQAALQKNWFAAATLAVRIAFATMLTAANLSQSYQITTHCTSEFASIHSISETVRTSSYIAIVLEQGSPFDHRMLGIPELQALIQLFVDKLFTGLKRLRTAPHLGPWKEVVYISHLR